MKMKLWALLWALASVRLFGYAISWTLIRYLRCHANYETLLFDVIRGDGVSIL